MEPLKTEFVHDGFNYQQMNRTGRYALFEQSRGGRIVAYEVIRVQRLPEEQIRGKLYPAREKYPRSEQWGTDGWTATSLAAARRKMDQVTGVAKL